jgi:rod shape-determining protein MreC
VAQFRLDRLTPIITLFAFLLIWWLTPNIAKLFLEKSFQEFQAPMWLATHALESETSKAFLKTKSKDDLIDVITALKRKNAFYQQIDGLNKTYKDEIERLESILSLQNRFLFKHEFAHVIQRNIGSWWQTIRINKGRKHGVQKGDAVIFAGGVVGRIASTNYYTSEIDLLTSDDFRISATFQGDQRPLIYEGSGTNQWGQISGTIKNAPQDLMTNSIEPIHLVTTGLGGKFPAGIKIGEVPWLEPDNTGLFQAGKVNIDQRLLGIKEVVILIPYNRLEELNDGL